MITSEFTAEFGDCDEAGIVFYPNYFYWFDCLFQRLLRARGLSQRELRKRFGAVTPIVDVGAKFLAPVSYDAVITGTAAIETWEERRFRIVYAMDVEGRRIVDGFEVRAWAVLGDGGRIRGGPVAPDFRDLFPT